MQVWVILRYGSESQSIYAVRKTEKQAREAYDELKKEMLKNVREMLNHSCDESNDLWKRQLRNLKQCFFPNITPKEFMLEQPAVEIHHVPQPNLRQPRRGPKDKHRNTREKR